MTEVISSTVISFEEVQAHLKQLDYSKCDKSTAKRIIGYISAMSVCIHVLRGLDGDDYFSEKHGMTAQEMIEKIKACTLERNIEYSVEEQFEWHIALYDNLYAKLFNIIDFVKKY